MWRMGFYVHLHVAFACGENEGVARLAAEHRARLNGESAEAGWFLDDLAKRTGRNPGPKGGLSLWGIVGDYTSGERFVGALMPFWGDLLRSEVDGGPPSHAHILVFEEAEQTERAIAFEVFLNDAKALTVKRHELPFCFSQY
jgi:hypothetical protein